MSKNDSEPRHRALRTGRVLVARLSYNMVQVLAHWAKVNHGRGSEIHRFKPHIERRSIRALKARNLLVFNPLFGTYSPTSHGERALIEHGFSVSGEMSRIDGN